MSAAANAAGWLYRTGLIGPTSRAGQGRVSEVVNAPAPAGGPTVTYEKHSDYFRSIKATHEELKDIL